MGKGLMRAFVAKSMDLRGVVVTRHGKASPDRKKIVGTSVLEEDDYDTR